jgi:hypothetical protein
MSEYFGIEDAKIRMHYQQPGQMFNLHIDKLQERCPDDPERVIRMTIMLADWQPGQFYLYGTNTYSHWHAGDVHVFDWANVPHATANASRYMRPVLQVTGLKTEKTRRMLAVGNTIGEISGMKQLLIFTGPQGSGNHLWSKIFALHP